MNALSDPLSVTIGCILGYHATHAMSALFILQPSPESGHAVLHESFTAGSGMPFAETADQHGNRVLRTTLVSGYNEFRYEAALLLREEQHIDLAINSPSAPADAVPIEALPMNVLRYTFPSRYCESDKLYDFARERFGHAAPGLPRARAVCDWVHRHLEYRYGSGDSSLSACDALKRGYGVCRDFAHVMIALCRAMDLPARYVAGHVPLLEANQMTGDNDIGADFHAYVEVYAHGCWHTFDPRYNRDFKGRIKIAHGMDAVDAAFATFYGYAEPVHFQAWAMSVENCLKQERHIGAGQFNQTLDALAL